MKRASTFCLRPEPNRSRNPILRRSGRIWRNDKRVRRRRDRVLWVAEGVFWKVSFLNILKCMCCWAENHPSSGKKKCFDNKCQGCWKVFILNKRVKVVMMSTLDKENMERKWFLTDPQDQWEWWSDCEHVCLPWLWGRPRRGIGRTGFELTSSMCMCNILVFLHPLSLGCSFAYKSLLDRLHLRLYLFRSVRTSYRAFVRPSVRPRQFFLSS